MKMDKNKIEVGDFVSVYWDKKDFFDVEVLYTPQDTGDSWRLKSKDNTLIYVMNFNYMLLFKKGDENG